MGLAKAAMFLAAGVLVLSAGRDDLASLRGAVAREPLAFAALTLAGVSLIGLPPSLGFAAKWQMMQAALLADQWPWLLWLLGGTLLSAAYVFRVLRLAFLPASEAFEARAPLLLGLRFGLDGLGTVFLLLAGLLWSLAGWAAQIYHRHDERHHALWGFWLAALSGNLWLIVAQNAIGFYAGFALMSFAAYGLVVHARSADAWRAGRVYLIMAVLGEALLLSGLLLRVAGSESLALPLAANGGQHASLSTALIFLGTAGRARCGSKSASCAACPWPERRCWRCCC